MTPTVEEMRTFLSAKGYNPERIATYLADMQDAGEEAYPESLELLDKDFRLAMDVYDDMDVE